MNNEMEWKGETSQNAEKENQQIRGKGNTSNKIKPRSEK